MTSMPVALRSGLLASLTALALTLDGCASTYYVKVQSKAEAQLDQALSYYLECASPPPAQPSLCQEAGATLAAEFFEIGMKEALTPEAADIIIQYGFAIDKHVEESVQYTGSVPALRTYPGRRSRARRTYNGEYVIGEVVTNTDYANTEKQMDVVAFEKQLILSAWDARVALQGSNTGANRIWRAKASITDGGVDFLSILPYLSNAAV